MCNILINSLCSPRAAIHHPSNTHDVVFRTNIFCGEPKYSKQLHVNPNAKKPGNKLPGFFENGGYKIRTCDPLLVRQVL